MISLWLPMMRDGDALNVVVAVVIIIVIMIIFSVAQQCEIVLSKPFEKSLRLLNFFCADRFRG